MRALVLGGTGMLGRAVAEHWRRRGETVLALSRQQADLRDREAIVDWAHTFHPEVIVNCAAFTQVDACESERELAQQVNGDAVMHAVEAARSVGAALLHVSSDYVFDGKGSEPYDEEHAVAPLSVYGQSKLAGEQQALTYERALVLRASWLFGPGGPNFVRTIRRLILQGKAPLRVVDDQVGCPTYTPFLARALRELAGQGATGLLHYRNAPALSWHGFAVEIARRTRVDGRLLEADDVLPVATTEFPRPAPRPAYSVLAVDRYETAVGRRVESWLAGLEAYLDLLGDEP